MAHQDMRDAATDPSAPPPPLLRGWMLTATDDRVLLSLRPPFLVVPAPGLPDGVQLRVRAAPEGNAAEASGDPFFFLSASGWLSCVFPFGLDALLWFGGALGLWTNSTKLHLGFMTITIVMGLVLGYMTV